MPVEKSVLVRVQSDAPEYTMRVVLYCPKVRNVDSTGYKPWNVALNFEWYENAVLWAVIELGFLAVLQAVIGGFDSHTVHQTFGTSRSWVSIEIHEQ